MKRKKSAMKIQSIVMPLIRQEIELLKSWLIHCPSAGVGEFTLYLSIDTCWDEQDQSEIKSVFESSVLASEGVSLVFIDCLLSSDESFYIKDPKQGIDLDKFPYGQKSGPNKQFFCSIRALLDSSASTGAVLLMETDAFPVVEGWLESLNRKVTMLPESTLVAGSNYRGRSKMNPALSTHLNGNSIYFLASDKFSSFLESWELLLLRCLRTAPHLAYDFVIPWYGIFSKKNKEVASLGDARMEALVRDFDKNCMTLSDLMINYGGEIESRINYKFKAAKFVKAFPDALVVHGRCFIKSIDELRAHYGSSKEATEQSTWAKFVFTVRGIFGLEYAPSRLENDKVNLVAVSDFDVANAIVDISQCADIEGALLAGRLSPDACVELIKDTLCLTSSQRELLNDVMYVPSGEGGLKGENTTDAKLEHIDGGLR